VLDLEDIESDTGRLLARKTARDRGSLSNKAGFLAGDVLYGKLRPYLNKVLIADRPGFCSTEIVPLRTSDDLDPRYLQLALTSPSFLSYANRRSYGMKMPRLGTDDLDNAEILTPPLAEQKRIVAKVDELMALCDRLEAQLRQRDELAGVLAKAAVARFQADPTVENLEYLFDKRYVVDPLALRSLLRDLVVTMAADDARGADQALADFLEGESSNGVSKSPSHGNSGVPILRISAGTSRKDQYVDEDDYKLVELTSEEIDRHKLRRGDLLSCRYNGNLHYVGRFSCYLGTSGKTHVNPDKLIRFRVDSSMALPRFVCIAMNSTYARRQIESMCATTAGNIGLSASKMKTVRVPIPPLHVQQALVSLHDRVSTLIDQLESQITASEEAGTKLLDALVAELAPSN
jgi:type I restriction enzyme S subunit